jgi:hypothetical protein
MKMQNAQGDFLTLTEAFPGFSHEFQAVSLS